MGRWHFPSKKPKRDDNDMFATYTIKSLQVEAMNARRVFPTNENLLTTLIEFSDELQALMQERTTGVKPGSLFPTPEKKLPMNAYLQSKALQVACLALRIYEEGDAAHDFNKPRNMGT